MARNIYSNITARGTRAVFAERFAAPERIWRQFVQEIDSDGPDEEHVWLGNVPDPREFISGRNLVGIRDFTYNVANKEYELTFLVDQNSMEDDRHGLVNRRIAEAAEVWAVYMDVLLAAALNAGGTAGSEGYDGVTFFNDSHVVGAATPDNNLTTDIATTTAPTLAEMKAEIRTQMIALQGMQDDTGREGYNWGALSKVAFMGNQNYEQTMKEAINAMLTGGGDSNPYFQNIAEPITNPFLGTTNPWVYMAAIGDPTRMPFIFQKRTELQIVILNSADQIAQNHGLLVLIRQRFRLAYGEFRRMVLTVFT